VIAFAKMVGFDVAPVTDQLSISSAKAPLSSSSRDSVSSQIETPAPRSSWSRLIAGILLGELV
jgi:hypothetical protein